MSSITFSTSFHDALADMVFGGVAPEQLVQQARRKLTELNRALDLFRSAVPDVLGVVLATVDGIPLAYDVPVDADPANVADAAAAKHRDALEDRGARPERTPASAFHPFADGRVLVVFLEGAFLVEDGGEGGLEPDPDVPDLAALDGENPFTNPRRN